jgi:hypothetical protein
MEDFTFPKEIKIYTITAKSFPEDIGEVHHRL